MQLTCLIIEDASFMREIYHYSLINCENIRIIGEAADGEEAMRLLAELKPDIMLLDLVLPLKSGAAADRIGSAGPGAAVPLGNLIGGTADGWQHLRGRQITWAND